MEWAILVVLAIGVAGVLWAMSRGDEPRGVIVRAEDGPGALAASGLKLGKPWTRIEAVPLGGGVWRVTGYYEGSVIDPSAPRTPPGGSPL